MKKNNNNILYIILAILGASTIVFLCLFLSFQNSSNSYKNQLENNYKKSYYEVVSNINDLEIDISKIVATKDNDALRTLLTSLNNNVTLTIDNINQLPISYNNLTNINNFLNKTSGFSSSLLDRIYSGESIKDNDYVQLNDIHSSVLAIKYDLNNYYAGLNSDFSILTKIETEGVREFSGGFINTESANSEVPSLIYDGPFSDSVLNKEIVGLSGIEISQDEALKKVQDIFDTNDINYVGFAKGKFETYNFYVNQKGLDVSITKNGGLLLTVTSYVTPQEKTIDANEAIKIAENFALRVGINNMYSVWTQTVGNIQYINLAKIENSCIYYSDLIKVKVDLSSGNVIGWEATNYATNNKSRNFTSSISMTQAQNKLSSVLSVKERNYCIIPDKYVGELSAYEFICTWKNYTYYVYIDSNTGKEANIMRVVNTTNGDLLQ